MNKNLGNNIARLRVKNNLTQAELADKLNFTYQTISNWERGVSFPDVESIGKLCAIFKVTSDELFGFEKIDKIGKDKTERVLLSYTDKSKVAKILSVLVYVMIISYVFYATLSLEMIKQTIFTAILVMISGVVFLLSFAGCFVLFLLGKKYSGKKIFLVLFYAFLATYLLLTIITLSTTFDTIKELYDKYGVNIPSIQLNNALQTQNVLVFISNLCYCIVGILVLFAFESKYREGKIYTLELSYFALCVISFLSYLVIGKAFTFLSVICFYLIYLIKEDKTVEIPYFAYAFEVPYISSIKSESVIKSKSAVDGTKKPIKMKLKMSDILGGTFLKVATITLFVLTVVCVVFEDVLSKVDIVVLVGVLPLIFYTLCFLLKKSHDIKISILNLIIITIYLSLQLFIYLEGVVIFGGILYNKPSGTIFTNIIVLINACLLCVSFMIYALKYGNLKDYFNSKVMLIVINFISAITFAVLAIVYPTASLGLLAIGMWLNMLSVLILSCFHKNTFV